MELQEGELASHTCGLTTSKYTAESKVEKWTEHFSSLIHVLTDSFESCFGTKPVGVVGGVVDEGVGGGEGGGVVGG